jgi:hypothetical protein
MTETPDPVVERATRAIPSLRASLNRLGLLANESTAGARFAPDDHFAFMGLTFHAKQLEHAKGVIVLNNHPDVALIVRSMLEGWWQLKWAHGDPQPRAEKWRAFSIIYDWRSIQDAKAAGIEVPQEREERTNSRLNGVRDEFLTGKARRARSEKNKLPADPFQATWHGMQIRQLVDEIGELRLYAGPYDEFSDRHHWAPAGIGQGIRVDGKVIRYDARDAPSTARALDVAFHCLYQSALLVNEHLALGFQDRLHALAERYIADSAFIGSGGVPFLDDPAPGAT